jgi:hypothetical protein
MGCALYIRCALSMHLKEFRKSLGCALYIGARYLPENTVHFHFLVLCYITLLVHGILTREAKIPWKRNTCSRVYAMPYCIQHDRRHLILLCWLGMAEYRTYLYTGTQHCMLRHCTVRIIFFLHRMLELSKICVLSLALHRKVTNTFQQLWEFGFCYGNWNKFSFCI